MWHKQSFTQFWSQSDAYSRRSSLKLTYIHHPLVVCTHQICCAVAVPIALSQDRLLHGHNRLVNWTPCSRMRESKLIKATAKQKIHQVGYFCNRNNSTWFILWWMFLCSSLPCIITGGLSAVGNCTSNVKRQNTLGCLDQYMESNSTSTWGEYPLPPQMEVSVPSNAGECPHP